MLASNSIDSDTLSKHWPFCAIKQSTHQLLFAVKTCAYYIGKKNSFHHSSARCI